MEQNCCKNEDACFYAAETVALPAVRWDTEHVWRTPRFRPVGNAPPSPFQVVHRYNVADFDAPIFQRVNHVYDHRLGQIEAGLHRGTLCQRPMLHTQVTVPPRPRRQTPPPPFVGNLPAILVDTSVCTCPRPLEPIGLQNYTSLLETSRRIVAHGAPPSFLWNDFLGFSSVCFLCLGEGSWWTSF